MSPEISSHGRPIGAEVRNVDASQSLSEPVVDMLLETLNRY